MILPAPRVDYKNTNSNLYTNYSRANRTSGLVRNIISGWINYASGLHGNSLYVTHTQSDKGESSDEWQATNPTRIHEADAESIGQQQWQE